MDNLEQHLADRAYVRNMVEHELEIMHNHTFIDEEPEVTFSVKLPVSDMALLEQIAGYLKGKKTPLASALLREALQDAYWTILQVEDDKGRGKEAREHFRKVHHLEDGNGTVRRGVYSDGEGEVG